MTVQYKFLKDVRLKDKMAKLAASLFLTLSTLVHSISIEKLHFRDPRLELPRATKLASPARINYRCH